MFLTARKKVIISVMAIFVVGLGFFGLWQYKDGKLFSSAATLTSGQTFTDVPPITGPISKSKPFISAGLSKVIRTELLNPIRWLLATKERFLSLALLAGGDTKVPTPSSNYHCRDVQPNYWAYKYVQYLYEKGDLPECNIYANGYTLSPTLPLTRDVMAEWLASALAGGRAKSRPDQPPPLSKMSLQLISTTNISNI